MIETIFGILIPSIRPQINCFAHVILFHYVGNFRPPKLALPYPLEKSWIQTCIINFIDSSPSK